MSSSPRGWSRLTTFLCLALLAFVSLGCKADQLTSRGTDIVLLYDEPEGCENLGVVIGRGGGLSGAYSKPSVNRQSAENNARNEAAARGATHLLLHPEQVAQGDGSGPDYQSTTPAMAHGSGTGSTVTVAGTAYKCPPGAVVAEPVAAIHAGGSMFLEVQPPTSISVAPLGEIQHITVFRRAPNEAGTGMTETQALRVEDPEKIQEVVGSLQQVAEDPLKYIPTHRVELVGELGTQSLLYGFGYLQYAGKVYRLTDGAFESVLMLREEPTKEPMEEPTEEPKEEPSEDPAD
ncbi:MAG: hypothetical protein AMS21_00300 [Gemmatimonas sp. SG8_38_2]|nr:MAG: hypothetical protein AMS21_00300 [Gemmatimonas sp. SG8_38_2]